MHASKLSRGEGGISKGTFERTSDNPKEEYEACIRVIAQMHLVHITHFGDEVETGLCRPFW